MLKAAITLIDTKKQKGKEAITGYQAEAWHLRYVGDIAETIYTSNLTLEEYLGVEGGNYAD